MSPAFGLCRFADGFRKCSYHQVVLLHPMGRGCWLVDCAAWVLLLARQNSAYWSRIGQGGGESLRLGSNC